MSSASRASFAIWTSLSRKASAGAGSSGEAVFVHHARRPAPAWSVAGLRIDTRPGLTAPDTSASPIPPQYSSSISSGSVGETVNSTPDSDACTCRWMMIAHPRERDPACRLVRQHASRSLRRPHPRDRTPQGIGRRDAGDRIQLAGKRRVRRVFANGGAPHDRDRRTRCRDQTSAGVHDLRRRSTAPLVDDDAVRDGRARAHQSREVRGLASTTRDIGRCGERTTMRRHVMGHAGRGFKPRRNITTLNVQ